MVALIDLTVWCFPCFVFFQNSLKYGQGSIRNVRHIGHSTHRPMSSLRKSAIKPTTTTTSLKQQNRGVRNSVFDATNELVYCLYISYRIWATHFSLFYFPLRFLGPKSDRVCLLWKLVDMRCHFQTRSRLSTKLFGVFCGFLWNSVKYGLGSLRKTPTDGTPPLGSGPTSGQLATYS